VSQVRENLMSREGYTPYCGKDRCSFGWPRTTWYHGQFECMCGWRSEFPAEFVEQYKAKWGKK
jgi:hypothetical protein